ncbi:hypothetical protein TNCV_1826661 [Trichonephila clavipes]|nr:hypothetical protein TNCV_1826661 [Trichonephila clavipes]
MAVENKYFLNPGISLQLASNRTGWGVEASFFEHVAVMFVRREGVEWNICVSARLSQKHGVIEAAGAFAVEVYFSNSRSLVALQRAFRRHFIIPPQSRVPRLRSEMCFNVD